MIKMWKRLWAEAANGLAVCLREALGEEISEEGNVLATLPQRRQREADGGEAVRQVGPQRTR